MVKKKRPKKIKKELKNQQKKIWKVSVGQQYKEFEIQKDAKTWTKQLVDADVYFIMQEGVIKE